MKNGFFQAGQCAVLLSFRVGKHLILWQKGGVSYKFAKIV